MKEKPVSYWGLRFREDSIDMGYGTFMLFGLFISAVYHGPWAR